MSIPIEDINALLELINENDEHELEKECALRGIKYKKKNKLQKVELDTKLDDAVKRIMNNGR
jgi:hypothetical protein